MRGVILAGGRGTRLQSVVRNRSKLMAEIAGRPFLEYLVLQLRQQGIVDLVLCVGHQAAGIQAYFGDGERWDVRIRYSVEAELRGTAGALKLAEPLLDQTPFLVMNGDSYFGIDLHQVHHAHQTHQALATLALAPVADPERFGTVALDETGRIVGFHEKAAERRTGWINGGIYLFERAVLEQIPEGRVVSLEHELFPALIGQAFYGVPFRAFFVDIGIPSAYQSLQADPEHLLTLVEQDLRKGEQSC